MLPGSAVRNPNARDENAHILLLLVIKISERFQPPGDKQEAQDSDLSYGPRDRLGQRT